MTATMTTATTTGPADGTETGTETGTDTTRLFGPRGRHRKPRPRKALLAAGGLALAAGALSLVRMTPDAGLGGYGATEADPQAAPGTDSDIDIDTGTDRATNAAATVGSVPRASPSSTAAMGGISATPAPGTSHAPTGSATAVPLPLAAAPTTIPEAPNTPASTPTAFTTPHAPATTTAPQPARTTPPPAPTPTSQPTHTTQPAPGLCVPIIGLCVQQRG
ncbi:hypothetical protein [Streptomyces canus]|uniref:hypothetical protein n=1 Tax=Streptomyces canus TaxID=58343 RepID=UPI002E295946|nr:hypothetical protein [Streptomyces canus]